MKKFIINYECTFRRPSNGSGGSLETIMRKRSMIRDIPEMHWEKPDSFIANEIMRLHDVNRLDSFTYTLQPM